GITAGNETLTYQTCAFAKGQPAPVICDPTTAFNTLFGSVAAGAGQETFRERNELLDFAREDVNRALSEFGGSSTERAKLEQYLASIEEISARPDQLLEMTDALTAVKPEDPETNALYSSTQPLDHLQAQFDLATAALQGGLT